MRHSLPVLLATLALFTPLRSPAQPATKEQIKKAVEILRQAQSAKGTATNRLAVPPPPPPVPAPTATAVPTPAPAQEVPPPAPPPINVPAPPPVPVPPPAAVAVEPPPPVPVPPVQTPPVVDAERERRLQEIEAAVHRAAEERKAKALQAATPPVPVTPAPIQPVVTPVVTPVPVTPPIPAFTPPPVVVTTPPPAPPEHPAFNPPPPVNPQPIGEATAVTVATPSDTVVVAAPPTVTAIVPAGTAHGGLTTETEAKAREVLRQSAGAMHTGELSVAPAPISQLITDPPPPPEPIETDLVPLPTEEEFKAERKAKRAAEKQARAAAKATAREEARLKTAAEREAKAQARAAAAAPKLAAPVIAISAPVPPQPVVDPSTWTPRQRKLAELLEAYRRAENPITPDEYHRERIRIIAENPE